MASVTLLFLGVRLFWTLLCSFFCYWGIWEKPLAAGTAVKNLGCLRLGCHNKIPWVGGLKNKMYFSHRLEAGSPRPRCLYSLVLVKTLLLSCRQLPSHCILSWQRALGSLPLLIRIPVLLDLLEHLQTHLTLVTSLKTLSPTIVTRGIKASTYELGEHNSSHSSQQ